MATAFDVQLLLSFCGGGEPGQAFNTGGVLCSIVGLGVWIINVGMIKFVGLTAGRVTSRSKSVSIDIDIAGICFCMS